jgi:hypothetical protein
LWLDEYSEKYFNLTAQYHDRIIIEVFGHDHYGDLRYHSLNATEGTYFHNMIEAPSVTVNKKQNPGITWFEVDEATQKPTGLKY